MHTRASYGPLDTRTPRPDTGADVFARTPDSGQAVLETPQEMLSMVDDIVDMLLRRGITAEELAPLRRLRRAIARLEVATHCADADQDAMEQAAPPPVFPPPVVKDMRSGRSATADDLLARICAVIELLIQGGYPAEAAAQTVARQMLASGIQMPEGGDARGWKRLLQWHNRLVHARKRGPDYEEYLRFKAELNAIPPEQRIRAALAGRLWDRRRLDEVVSRGA